MPLIPPRTHTHAHPRTPAPTFTHIHTHTHTCTNTHTQHTTHYNQGEVDAFFEMFDDDKDDRITKDEYKGELAVMSYFEETDTNKDDVMTKAEVMTHFEEGHPEQIGYYLA